MPAAPKELGDELAAKFRKTASVLGSHPWNLFKGEAWLQKLCDEGCSGIPPTIAACFESRLSASPDPVAFPALRAAEPRSVRVVRSKMKARKRPAANIAPAAAAPAGDADAPRVLRRPAMRRPAAAIH